MKGQIVSIGALSSDKILQVSDGTWLSRKVHQVKRIEIVRPLENKRLVNPSPKWKGLDKVVVIPPYETVDEDDEVDGVVENDINSGGTTTTADTTSPGPAESNDSGEPTAGNQEQEEQEEEQIPKYTSRSEKNKRERTSCGTTNNSHWVETRRDRTEENYLDMRRATHTYIRWARDGVEYDKAKSDVNKMYLHTLKYGIVHKFYEKKPFAVSTKTEFKKSIQNLRDAVNNRIRTNAIAIAIKFDVTFMDNPSYGEHGRSNESNRSRQTIEEMLKFEYKMKTLQLQTCSVSARTGSNFRRKTRRVPHDARRSSAPLAERRNIKNRTIS